VNCTSNSKTRLDLLDFECITNLHIIIMILLSDPRHKIGNIGDALLRQPFGKGI